METNVSVLEFEEYADQVRSNLVTLGLQQANAESECDLVVFLGYGIGEPQSMQYSYSVPVYGTRGGGTTYFRGSYDGGYFRGTATEPLEFGVVGSQSYSGTVLVYLRRITVAVFEGQAYRSGKLLPVWETQIKSRGKNPDLRQVFPHLLSTGAKYFGKNTGREVEEVVRPAQPTRKGAASLPSLRKAAESR
jgi:hypothetical protein